MAGWDDSTQFQATMAGASIEFGTATIASNTVEVYTRLKAIRAAFIMNADDPTAADSVWCDRVITASQVTLESDFDGEVQYLLIGY